MLKGWSGVCACVGWGQIKGSIFLEAALPQVRSCWFSGSEGS